MPVEIVVTDREEPRASGRGRADAVRITAAIDGRPLFCEVSRKAGERVVRWSMSGTRASRHEHPLGFRDEGWVLRKAIDSAEADAVYRASALAGAAWDALGREAAR